MGTNTWVSGMRGWHADTLTRLFSGSAHETQTFLINLWTLKNNHQTLASNEYRKEIKKNLTITSKKWYTNSVDRKYKRLL